MEQIKISDIEVVRHRVQSIGNNIEIDIKTVWSAIDTFMGTVSNIMSPDAATLSLDIDIAAEFPIDINLKEAMMESGAFRARRMHSFPD